MQLLAIRCMEGALAGLAATVPMTLVMFAGQRMIPWWRRSELPPRKITEEAIGQTGLSAPPEPLRTTIVAGNHFGYGALMGALYRTVTNSRTDLRVTEGIACGLGIWTVSYLGWLPAAGLYPSATRELPERNALMITAHIVWGASFSLALQAMKCSQPITKSVPGSQAMNNHADSFTIIYHSNDDDAETIETGLSETQAVDWLQRKAKATGGLLSADLIVSTPEGSESWQAVRAE
ncbi:MAG: DUF1440 domain-containing protein [Pirellulaceae bacterium]|nr:DUF1440 domain-containing protein [Pirellulaceae bacterium]